MQGAVCRGTGQTLFLAICRGTGQTLFPAVCRGTRYAVSLQIQRDDPFKRADIPAVASLATEKLRDFL